MSTRILHGVWLGRRAYREVHELQLALHEHVKRADHDVVLLLEHEPTITSGRGAHPENLLADEATLARRGVAHCPTDRGGDVTLHAPGQLVAYPIVNLNHGVRDVRRYVNTLTTCMQRLIEPYGISAGTMPGMIGLWADQAALGKWPGAEAAVAPVKLGAIGVRISRWVTLHGFALNLSTDLALFGLIVPCGIKTHPVASVRSLTGTSPDVREASHHAHHELCALLTRSPGECVEHAGSLEVHSVLGALGSRS